VNLPDWPHATGAEAGASGGALGSLDGLKFAGSQRRCGSSRPPGNGLGMVAG
jgi:hypothetical protein